MYRLLLALLATLWLAAPAWGAVCTFSASGDWTAIGAHPAADCAPITNADDVVIPTGITITIKGTITFDGTTDSSITVESGGTLQCTITDTDAPSRLCEIAYNTTIDCQAGSTCNFQGAYRQFGNVSPELQTTLSAASYGFAGQLLPCPAYDVSADTFKMDCTKHETSTLELTGEPIANGDVTLTLDGVGYTIAILDADTVGEVATKIADASDIRDNGYYAGQNRMDETTIFVTAATIGAKTDIGFSAGTTGLAFTLTKIHDGEASGYVTGADRGSNEWEYGLIYDYAAYDQVVTASEGGSTHIIEAIGDMAAGDVLCWADLDLTDTWAPHDVNQCYEVVLADDDTIAAGGIEDAGAANQYAVIILSVLQTDESNKHHSDYPFYLRSVKADVADVAVGVGGRTVITTGTDLIHESKMLPGRFLRSGNCATPGACLLGELSDVPYIISEDTDDVGGDQFKIGRLNGFSTAIAAGDDVIIDYGWREGHPFFVMKPAIIKSAATEHTDTNATPIELDGTHTLEAVLLDSIFAIDETVAPASIEHVWIRDPRHRNTWFITNTSAATFALNHVVITGGAEKCDIATITSQPTQSCHDNHGFSLNGTDVTFTGTDIAARHLGDAMFTGIQSNNPLNLTRIRCDAGGRGGDSSNWLAAAGKNPSGTWQDIVLTSCTSTDGAADIYADQAVTTTKTVIFKNVVDISNNNIFKGSVTDRAAAELQNYLRIGSSADSARTPLPQRADRFVYREGTIQSGQNIVVQKDWQSTLKNSILRNLEWATNIEMFKLATGHNAVWDNNAWIDIYPESSITGLIAMIRGLKNATPGILLINRNSFVWRPGFDADADYWLYVQGGSGTHGLTMTNNLMYGFAGAQTPGSLGNTECVPGSCRAMGGNVISDMSHTGLCIDNGYEADGTTAALEAVAGTVVRDEALQLTDIPGARVDPIAGGAADVAACGIKRGAGAPGITRPNWALSVTGLEPEFIGDPQAGGGGGGGRNPRTY